LGQPTEPIPNKAAATMVQSPRRRCRLHVREGDSS
jgi:hypothetical protein